jgi:hypothetical protein
MILPTEGKGILRMHMLADGMDEVENNVFKEAT